MRSAARVIVALVAVTLGSALLVAGSAALVVFGTDGIVRATSTATTPSVAWLIDVDRIDGGLPAVTPWDSRSITVEPLDGEPFVVGLASRADAVAYLSGVPYDVAAGIDGRTAAPDPERVDGNGIPLPPADQTFWIQRTSGSSTLVLDLTAAEPGSAVLVLRADGSAPVAVRWTLDVGARWLPWAGGAAVLIGLLLLGVGLWLLFRRQQRDARTDTSATGAGPSEHEWGTPPIASDDFTLSASYVGRESAPGPRPASDETSSRSRIPVGVPGPGVLRGAGPEAPPREPDL